MLWWRYVATWNKHWRDGICHLVGNMQEVLLEIKHGNMQGRSLSEPVQCIATVVKGELHVKSAYCQHYMSSKCAVCEVD